MDHTTTTLKQIGTATLARIGARDFVTGMDSLTMTFGPGGARLRKIVVYLCLDDTYTVRRADYRRKDWAELLDRKVDGIQADQLAGVVLEMAEAKA